MSSGSVLSGPEWAPFRIEPMFDGRVWGYRDLRPWYAYAGEKPVGEVWLTGDDCAVATGWHAGTKLGELFAKAPGPLLGPGAASAGSPLLIKAIFAREKLSVQVHPDDRLAHKYGFPRGKTECWYVLAAEAGAEIAVGLKPGVTIDRLRDDIESHALESDLNLLTVRPGDVILMDAGTVHAIWPGSILLETQQNSDITYRLYDYDRGRELHIEKGLEAVKTQTRAGRVSPAVLSDRTILIDAEYFRLDRIPIAGSLSSDRLAGGANAAGSPQGLSYLFAAGGRGRIAVDNMEPVELPTRAIVCVPAASPRFQLENAGGLELIRIVPQWPAAA